MSGVADYNRLNGLLHRAIHAAQTACAGIMTIYRSSDFNAGLKADNSPLTLADRQAHEIITDCLKVTQIPVLSEEGRNIPYAERKQWEYLWLVDPLDGTKEFLNRNGEFTVNVALIHHHIPVLGVVAVPVTGEVYFGGKGIGAFVRRGGLDLTLPKRTPVDLRSPGLRVVASRSHMNEETRAFIESLNNPVLVFKGSSLKFMMLAEDLADVYPRFGPTMEWDTAAAEAILKETGCTVNPVDAGVELVYNKPDLLNPHFICRP